MPRMRSLPRRFSAVVIDNGINSSSISPPVDTAPITSLSGCLSLQNFPSLKVDIQETVGKSYVGMRLNPGIYPTTKALEFSVKFTLASFQKVVADIEKEWVDKNISPRGKTRITNDTLAGFTIFNRILRDLEFFATLMVAAGHISNSCKFPSVTTFTHTYGNDIAPSTFRMIPVLKKNLSEKYSIKFLEIRDVFDRIVDNSVVSNELFYPSFARSLAYFLTALQQRQPASRLIYFISTIESMLISNRNNESSSQALIAERAKAILMSASSDLVGDLRSIYKIRNEFLHGNKKLSATLGGSETFPRGKEDGLLMWVFDEADKAHQIAHSLLQRYFLHNVEDFTFSTIFDGCSDE